MLVLRCHVASGELACVEVHETSPSYCIFVEVPTNPSKIHDIVQLQMSCEVEFSYTVRGILFAATSRPLSYIEEKYSIDHFRILPI